jgi:hypothetical protein
MTMPDRTKRTCRSLCVRQTEGKKTVYRLHFTRSVANTEVPLIAADAIYNRRSSLDHLMGALVPKKKRDSVIFPIFFRGVWRAEKVAENAQRTKEREPLVEREEGRQTGGSRVLKEVAAARR